MTSEEKKMERLNKIVELIKEYYSDWIRFDVVNARTLTEWLHDAVKGLSWMSWTICQNRQKPYETIYLDDIFFAVEKIVEGMPVPFTKQELKFLDMNGINLTKLQRIKAKQEIEDWIYDD